MIKNTWEVPVGNQALSQEINNKKRKASAQVNKPSSSDEGWVSRERVGYWLSTWHLAYKDDRPKGKCAKATDRRPEGKLEAGCWSTALKIHHHLTSWILTRVTGWPGSHGFRGRVCQRSECSYAYCCPCQQNPETVSIPCDSDESSCQRNSKGECLMLFQVS